MKNQGQGLSERMMLVILFAVLIGVLGIFWAIVQRPVGMIYHGIRTLESLGLWYITPWARSFHNLAFGKIDAVPFQWIYISSIPFGLVIALIILLIGHYVAKRARTEHLNAYIAHDKNTVPDWRAIMRRQAVNYPANQFFLDYSLNEFSDISKGVARFPYRAIDVIYESDAYAGTRVVDGLEALRCDRNAISDFLKSYMGPANPFFSAGTNYTVSNDPIPAQEALSDIINNKLEWHHCLLLYPTLYRLYGSLVDTGEDFSLFISRSDEFLREVWRDLNALKSQMGDSLVLGFQDEDDEKFKRAEFSEKYNNTKELFTLEDYLNSQSKVTPNTKIADNLPTVIKARRELLVLLTEHRHRSNRVPAGRDKKTGFIYKSREKMSDSERIFAARALEQQMKFVRHIEPILMRHAYISTMLAASLDEKAKGARSLGVLAPAQFRWMRFYDYKLWSFLRPIGGKTTVPEAAGVFQHYQDELEVEQGIIIPQTDRAVDAIITEADNYMTTAQIQELEEATKRRRNGSSTNRFQKMGQAVRDASDDTLTVFPKDTE